MNKLISKSFLWMFIGLLVTFATGYVVSVNDSMISAVFESSLYWIFAIVELILVIFFSARVHKMKPTTARICFLLYSFVSGLTFSSIFIVFEITNIIYVFLIAAIIFGIFGAIGYYTKLDLTKLGTYLLMFLLAIVICAIVNIFIGSSTFDLIISIISLLVFLGFTAYDVQNIKKLAETDMDNDVVAINGAFELYLDFINIFLHLIEIISDAKD